MSELHERFKNQTDWLISTSSLEPTWPGISSCFGLHDIRNRGLPKQVCLTLANTKCYIIQVKRNRLPEMAGLLRAPPGRQHSHRPGVITSSVTRGCTSESVRREMLNRVLDGAEMGTDNRVATCCSTFGKNMRDLNQLPGDQHHFWVVTPARRATYAFDRRPPTGTFITAFATRLCRLYICVYIIAGVCWL